MAKQSADNIDFSEDDDLVTEGSSMVDFSDTDDPAGFELMPRAMYPCVIEELEFTYSEKSGNPMWSWVLEVEEGEFAGRKLFYYTVFEGKGKPFTKKTLSRVAPELLEAPFDPQQVADDGTLLGRRVRARVGTKRYQGETRNDVKDLFEGEGQEFV